MPNFNLFDGDRFIDDEGEEDEFDIDLRRNGETNKDLWLNGWKCNLFETDDLQSLALTLRISSWPRE